MERIYGERQQQPNEAMAGKLDSLISRFDQDGDESLNLKELSSAGERATDDDDKSTIDFAQRYFGSLSIYGAETDDGISRHDARELGYKMWQPERFPADVRENMTQMYEELARMRQNR